MIMWILFLFSFQYLFQINFSWFFIQANLFCLSFKFYTTNYIFILTVILVSLMVGVFSKFYMESSLSKTSFSLWVLLFILSMIILLMSDSWWTLFIGWEGLGLTSFWLVAYYSSWTAHNGAILTFLTNRIGDTCLVLAAIFWIKNYDSWGLMIFWNYILIFMAICTKSAQFPFVSWLPAAMSAPTPVSALVHSSTLVTAGLFLAMKFNWSFIMGMSITWMIGGLTMLVGSWTAQLDFDLKKVVAFSTLSQLGMLFLLFSSGFSMVVLFHLVMHGFFKSNLFICVGVMIGQTFSNQSIFKFSSSLISSLTHSSIFYYTLINLGALPFLSGFFSKENGVIHSFSNMNITSLFMFILLLSMTFSYTMRLFLSWNQKCLDPIQSISSFGVGSLIAVILMLPLGYMWVMNLSFNMQGLSTFQVALILLPLISLFNVFMNLFYYITNFIKLNFKLLWLNNFNSSNHLFHFNLFISSNFTWQKWIFLMVLLFLSLT